MAGTLTGRIVTIRQAVSLHKRTRFTTNRLSRYSRQPWAFLVYPIKQLYRVREDRALKALVDLEPEHPDEAREKLLYLLALMTANAADLPLGSVERAIRTLRPFRSGLAEALGGKTPRTANAVDESLPLASVERQSPRLGA